MPRLNQHFQHSGISYSYFKCHLPPKARVTPHSSSSFYFNEGVHSQLHRKIFLFIAVFICLFHGEFQGSLVLGVHYRHVTGSMGEVTVWAADISPMVGVRWVLAGQQLELTACTQPSPLFWGSAGSDNGAVKVKALFKGWREEHRAALSGKLSCHFRSWLNALSSFRK